MNYFKMAGANSATLAELIARANARIAAVDHPRMERENAEAARRDLAIDPAAVPVRREAAPTGVLDRVAAECGVDPARARATAASREWQERIAASDARAASQVVARSAEEFCRRNRDVLVASGMSDADIQAGLADGSIEKLLRSLGGLR